MSAPKRVRMSRQHPWRTDNPDAVIVARPSRWGNPFRVGDPDAYWSGPGWDSTRRPNPIPLMDAQHVVDIYRSMVVTNFAERFSREEVTRDLAGKDLACWCPLDQPCHGDVLLDIANRDDS
jgi:hypothetical protein